MAVVLLSQGRCMLLYPGGARELFKGPGADKYQLMWQEKLVSEKWAPSTTITATTNTGGHSKQDHIFIVKIGKI